MYSSAYQPRQVVKLNINIHLYRQVINTNLLFVYRSPIVPEALVILRNASTTEEGEFGWPAPRKDAADWLLEETSRNIKTTSYGLYQ